VEPKKAVDSSESTKPPLAEAPKTPGCRVTVDELLQAALDNLNHPDPKE